MWERSVVLFTLEYDVYHCWARLAIVACSLSSGVWVLFPSVFFRVSSMSSASLLCWLAVTLRVLGRAAVVGFAKAGWSVMLLFSLAMGALFFADVVLAAGLLAPAWLVGSSVVPSSFCIRFWRCSTASFACCLSVRSSSFSSCISF
eukprot:GILJ01033120.1.p1 GENE.GILJ01033120.1~~GILJ01033120.1.p1  ORF type:complete len:146 (+),score=7.63 GILJ01033120.1:243-680(+)